MSTVIRPELSRRNKYYISKHRYYELKHFCLQYDEMKNQRKELEGYLKSKSIIKLDEKNPENSPVENLVESHLYLDQRIKLIEHVALLTDSVIGSYIFKAVTKGYSFNYLKMRMNLPCEKDMYYDRYRKFFWLLSRYLQRLL